MGFRPWDLTFLRRPTITFLRADRSPFPLRSGPAPCLLARPLQPWPSPGLFGRFSPCALPVSRQRSGLGGSLAGALA